MVKVAEMGDTAASEANGTDRIQRWAAFLSKFSAIVPGELNFVADYASRHVALRARTRWLRAVRCRPTRGRPRRRSTTAKQPARARTSP